MAIVVIQFSRDSSLIHDDNIEKITGKMGCWGESKRRSEKVYVELGCVVAVHYVNIDHTQNTQHLIS